jgi:hypothetical protein
MHILHSDDLLSEIREPKHWHREKTGESLMHVQQLLTGYRCVVLGIADRCPYAPGGDRAVSWEAGAAMARRDLDRASAKPEPGVATVKRYVYRSQTTYSWFVGQEPEGPDALDLEAFHTPEAAIADAEASGFVVQDTPNTAPTCSTESRPAP